MKKLYSGFLLKSVFIILILYSKSSFSQCATGPVSLGKSYDTTVSTGSGNYATIFKFPKFRPDSGMVTCVRLILTITGIANIAIENHVNASTIYNATYNRKDTLSGFGLSSPLTQEIIKSYGPYNLAANDGSSFGGPDYIHIGPDSVLKSYTLARTITDVNELTNFYGLDSAEYAYKINASANASGSGDFLFDVSTSGTVNFKLEYCYCPPTVLPLNLSNFQVNKTVSGAVLLSWQSEVDTLNYYYEVQSSHDGKNFTNSGTVLKQTHTINPSYNFQYLIGDGASGRYFFRIKQRFPNGYTRYTTVKYLDFETEFSKISLYPNPSTGVVGIKFANISSEKLLVQITNVQGQVIVNRELFVSGTDYRQIATLQHGIYWVRMTDATTNASFVSQLIIK